jgi:hypothetical protein
MRNLRTRMFIFSVSLVSSAAVLAAVLAPILKGKGFHDGDL